MEFEWDAAKAALNLRKHGVAFEDAARVFLDGGRLEAYDGREDYGEDRWATIGQVYAAVLYVVYTVRHEDSIRTFPHGGHFLMRKKSTVKLTIDPNNPPPLTDEQKARLAALAAMPDDQIDTSDAPYRPDAVWMRAADKLPQQKQQITLRIDADVLDFFKHTGKRYQTRINAVLRSYVEAHKGRD
ncbi:MAG: BrnA antitoxin family protein [Pigmentiphaga sp.]|nr:BrnA antitoxin family protein [Pigmentiphaga sp.]